MKRLLYLAAVPGLCALLFGCRGSVAGVPAAAPALGPASQAAGAPAGGAANLKLSERTAGAIHVGSSNTVTADMPVPRPDTTPCVVPLFKNLAFKNFSNKTFSFAPPADCPGPWAKVVFNFDLRVTKGVQYDRTGIVWVDGAVIYFGTTAEPSSTLSPHWHVERDATDLSALFKTASQGQIELWNCYCPPTYNGYPRGSAYLQFYPADAKYPAPRVPDEVVGIPYSPPLGGVATLPHSPMQMQKHLPHDIVAASLDLYLQSQDKEEQWFMCVPDVVWRQSDNALGFCRNTAFREGVVSVDGQPAGLAPIYPWIFTGGMDPNLWFPIPGVQTLDFTPFRVDLTPFAGVLSNGSLQTIDVSVFRAFDYFSGAGDLLLYRDRKHQPVSGAITEDTLGAQPAFTALEKIAYGSGEGIFGGPPASGSVETRSRSDYTIAGYVQTPRGKVTTTVKAMGLFVNHESFAYGSDYVQLMNQNTHFETSTTTQGAGAAETATASYDYPLTVSYPILPMSTGYRLPIKVYQGFRAQTASGRGGRDTTDLTNTVKSVDTMLFNSSFQWIGVRNGASLQLYTYASSQPPICYGKQITSKNNAVATISSPGCTALPPHRGPPKQ